MVMGLPRVHSKHWYRRDNRVWTVWNVWSAHFEMRICERYMRVDRPVVVVKGHHWRWLFMIGDVHLQGPRYSSVTCTALHHFNSTMLISRTSTSPDPAAICFAVLPVDVAHWEYVLSGRITNSHYLDSRSNTRCNPQPAYIRSQHHLENIPGHQTTRGTLREWNVWKIQRACAWSLSCHLEGRYSTHDQISSTYDRPKLRLEYSRPPNPARRNQYQQHHTISRSRPTTRLNYKGVCIAPHDYDSISRKRQSIGSGSWSKSYSHVHPYFKRPIITERARDLGDLFSVDLLTTKLRLPVFSGKAICMNVHTFQLQVEEEAPTKSGPGHGSFCNGAWDAAVWSFG